MGFLLTRIHRWFVKDKSKTKDPPSESDVTKSRLTSPRVECVVCREDFKPKTCLKAPCNHFLCRPCLIRMTEVALGDVSLIPLRCCQKELSKKSVFQFLPPSLTRTRLEVRYGEVETPVGKRVYCVKGGCGMFIEAMGDSRMGYPKCKVCGTEVCMRCLRRAHPGEVCVQVQAQGPARTTGNGVDAGTDIDTERERAFLALVKEKKWQPCPRCSTVVERKLGCDIMYCVCKGYFCYICGRPLRTYTSCSHSLVR